MESENTNETFTITDDEIKRIVTSKKSEIVTSIVDGIAKQAQSSIEWYVRQKLSEAVSAEISIIIQEEVATKADAFRQAVRNAITESIASIGPLLVRALVDRAAKNLSESYTMSKVAKEIFE